MNEVSNAPLQGQLATKLADLKLAPTTELGGSGEPLPEEVRSAAMGIVPAVTEGSLGANPEEAQRHEVMGTARVLADLAKKYGRKGTDAPAEAQELTSMTRAEAEVAQQAIAASRLAVEGAHPEQINAPDSAQTSKAGPVPASQGARGDRHERRGPMHQASRDLVRGANGGESRQVEEYLAFEGLMEFSPKELAEATLGQMSRGVTPIFRFFLGQKSNALRMSVIPTGGSIQLIVADGSCWLIKRFPHGSAFSLDDVRSVNVVGRDG